MKSRMLALMSAITLFALLSIPAWAAASGQQQEIDGRSTLNPVPLINQPLVPDAIKPGGAGFTLTVNGTGFVSNSVVKWNGSPRTTSFVSSSSLRAAILASDVATPRTASVTVVNPGPGGGTSNVGYFLISVPNIYFSVASSFVGSNEITERPVLADLNGDGKLDLIGEAGGIADAITVRLGNGDGTFQPEVLYPTAASTNYPVVADFNGDGELDIAVLCESGVVSVLLGNGDGTFQAHVDSPVDAGLHNFSMAAGDFNGDGRLDLVVGYQDPNNSAVSVLLGNGDGTFQAPVDYPAGFEPGSMAVADLNRDGKLDIVAANFGNFGGNTVSVLLGNGDGTFRPQVQYATSGGPLSVIVADFNGDGFLDLAVDCSCGSAARCGYPGEISILLGNGDGTFKAHADYPADAFPYSVIAGDLSANGILDLAVPDLDYSEVSILLGTGNGTFGPARTFATSNRAVGAVLGDLNDDGKLDVVVGTDSGFTILLQNGSVTLSPPSLNFGTQLLGSGRTKNVTLTNVGTTTLTISSIVVIGTDATNFTESSTCGSSLGAGKQCIISVTFTPSQLGPRTAAIEITDTGLGSPQSIPLSGTGVTVGPNVTLSPTSLTYGTQLVGTTSPAQTITVSNYGTQILSITGLSITAPFKQTHTCGMSLAPGASCTIDVTFAPKALGSFNGTLSITDNAPDSPQTVSLRGTGTEVKLNPTSLSFGVVEVGQTKSAPTTLTNVGSTTLSITGITITGTDHDEFSQTNTCDLNVGAGKSCTITVTFKPSERGSDSADVSISDNGGGSPQQVPLSGAGCTVINRRCKTALPSSSAVQSALAADHTVPVPRSIGSNSVGTRVMELADSTRDDPFLANGTKRELLVRFWYPASVDQGCKLAQYTSPSVWKYFSELTRLSLPQVTTNSCLDAPVTNGEHPVVVFTPGYTGTFTDYTFLFEDLASRGYVVASIDHTYEATAVEFPDGRLVKSLVGSHLANTWQTDERSLSFALSARLEDLKFVLNELERLNTLADNPFAGRLDLTKVALAGHSLGGLTTWRAVHQDARFKAAILLDPYLSGASLESTETPVMLLAAGRAQWREEECPLWSDLRGPRFAVNLRGAEHVTPSDAVWLAKGAIKTGPMGLDKTIAAMRDYVAAFLDANLRGERSARLLSGPSSNYPDAVVTVPQDSICRGGKGK